MIIPILDLFDFLKETGSSKTPDLTEEQIYSFSHFFLSNKCERTPVLSGSIMNNGIIGYVPDLRDKKEKLDHKEKQVFNSNMLNYYKNSEEGCITIVADGVYAGYSFFKSKAELPLFCANTSCLILFKKDDKIIKKKYNSFDGLNLEWFVLKYHNYLKNILRGEGVKHFTRTICVNIDELNIPNLQCQLNELTELKKIDTISNKFLKIQKEVSILLNKQVNGFKITIEDEFSEIFNLIKGTPRFTEEAMYYSLSLDNKEKKFPVYGGEKEHDNAKSFVVETAKNIIGKQVKFFVGECLVLSMDGSAGSMTFKPKNEKFTLNHHAACVKIREKYINKINLKWFKYAYQNTLIELSVSKGSSKTLSKTALDIQVITAPKIEIQDEWVKNIEELEIMFDKIKKIGYDIEKVTEKELVSS